MVTQIPAAMPIPRPRPSLLSEDAGLLCVSDPSVIGVGEDVVESVEGLGNEVDVDVDDVALDLDAIGEVIVVTIRTAGREKTCVELLQSQPSKPMQQKS